MRTFKRIVNRLKKNNKTISFMESCTGGLLSNSITNIPGASEVFHFGAVTYSNSFKELMGVSKETINKYTVYSMETAKEMSKSICNYTKSNYGVGITGKINREDPNNMSGSNNHVFISIYDNDKDCYCNFELDTIPGTRLQNKNMILNEVINQLEIII